MRVTDDDSWIAFLRGATRRRERWMTQARAAKSMSCYPHMNLGAIRAQVALCVAAAREAHRDWLRYRRYERDRIAADRAEAGQ